MNENNGLLSEILDMEYAMFTNVNDIYGRASCQDDRKTFCIMRSSQLKSWSGEMREQYYRDLKNAQEQNRNIMTEKYGYMMEYTDPLAFKAFLGQLPPVPGSRKVLAERIVKNHVAWRRELIACYPALMKGARPTESCSDYTALTSYETYLRCELYTYSIDLLQLYDKYAADCKEAGINLDERILEDQVKQQGYKDLPEANDKMAKYR